ncbi:MAG: 5' nucleotidase, NT5C type [Bacillota bacterium]
MYKFGFDIDGVITDEGNNENNIWYKYFINHFGEKAKKVSNSYDFREAYDLPDTVIEDFLAKNKEKIFSSVPPYQEAIDFLTKLKNKGHKIILITARHEDYRDITQNWLNKNNIPYDRLYHDEDKAPLALNENLKLFVDDHKDNVREIKSAGIPALLFTRDHNLEADKSEYTARVNNWQEIKEYIYNYYLR